MTPGGTEPRRSRCWRPSPQTRRTRARRSPRPRRSRRTPATASTSTRVRFPAVRRGHRPAQEDSSTLCTPSRAASRFRPRPHDRIARPRRRSGAAHPIRPDRRSASESPPAATFASPRASRRPRRHALPQSRGAATALPSAVPSIPRAADHRARSGDAGVRSSASASGTDSAVTPTSVGSRWRASSTAAAAAGVAAAATSHLRGGDDQLRARVAGRERQSLARRPTARSWRHRSPASASARACRGARNARIEARRLPPRGERLVTTDRAARAPRPVRSAGRATRGSARLARRKHNIASTGRPSHWCARPRATGNSAAFLDRHADGRSSSWPLHARATRTDDQPRRCAVRTRSALS